MYPIVKKCRLHETVTHMEILAPAVAKKAMPGQFVILRIGRGWGAHPADHRRSTTRRRARSVSFSRKWGPLPGGWMRWRRGDALLDLVGPLGKPSDLEGKEGKKIAVVGGGLGIAIAYPQAKASTREGRMWM